MMMMVSAARLHCLLRILHNLREGLLRPGEIAGLQILAQRLQILLRRRFCAAARSRGSRSRGRRSRRCGGRRGGAGRHGCLRERIARQRDKVLLRSREVAALQVAAKLLKVADKLLNAFQEAIQLRQAA